MKFTATQAAAYGAAVLLATQPCLASSSHRHHHPLNRKHVHEHQPVSAREGGDVTERGLATCPFPTGVGLVAITPDKDNAGWAMSPDQFCTRGSYCPYACPPGQMMAQWKKSSGYYTGDRMSGGLYCGLDGVATKPYDDRGYCMDGTGTVTAVNKAGPVVSFCQTVVPGNEDIIIPNDVHDSATLAVPDTTYWDGTSAHYYINPPGIDANTGCHWGVSTKPIGNWAAYVCGANTDASGNTFVTLGQNPVSWVEYDTFATNKPTYGVKIECVGNCIGLPCQVDGTGSVKSDTKATGAGNAQFCVVTVPKGSKANIVVYNMDGSTGETSKPTTSAKVEAPTTSTLAPTTVAKPTTSAYVSTSTSAPVKVATTSSAPGTSSSTTQRQYGVIFQENGTSTSAYSWTSPTGTTPTTALQTSEATSTPTQVSKNEGAGQTQGNGAVAGLIIALAAAACML